MKIVNDVPAENQMKNSSVVSFLGESDAPVKILILGNSITRHGPKADIGWLHDWGMAASAPEKDYVHRLFAMLEESGKKAFVRVRQAASWERNFTSPDCLNEFKEEKDFAPNVILFRLGENVLEKDFPLFKDAILSFVKFLRPEGCKVIFTNCFWPREGRDNALKAASEELGAPILDIAYTSDDMMALGKFEHHGVSLHPSDEGMEMIAKVLFDHLKNII